MIGPSCLHLSVGRLAFSGEKQDIGVSSISISS